MIHLPRSVSEASAVRGQIRAGGTDLTLLRRRGVTGGELVDLRDVPGLSGIGPHATGGLAIGAAVTLLDLASDARIVAGWPALAAAADAVGNPQIRARATLGGSLLQEVRCAYLRSPEFTCSKRGGGKCFAREGDAELHTPLENGPCIAPHPSTTALALLVYGAQVEVYGSMLRDVPSILGDGADPRQTHALLPGEVLTAVVLPPAPANDRGGYARIATRAHAEFPLVEAAVRLQLDPSGRIASFAFAVNGIANRPQTWPDAARACVGLAPSDPKVDDVFSGLLPRSLPIRAAAYKANLVPGVLRVALDRALGKDQFRG